MTARAIILGCPIALAAACSDGGLTLLDAPALGDAGADTSVIPKDAGALGTPIVVRTSAPGSTVALGGVGSATWAAYRDDAGSWIALSPRAPGEYSFQSTSSRWAIALACADDRTSLVAIYERPASVTSLDAVLEAQCGDPPAASYILEGTFAHVPLTTGWLDFGYPLDARGAILIPAGANAPYEIVNVVGGTWDLAFGLRDDSGTTLTKIAIVRAKTLAADTKIDIDFDTAGVTPDSRKLTIDGIVSGEEIVAAPVVYTTGEGREGIDVGPQNVPAKSATIELAYSALPSSAQQPADRYRPFIVASRPDSVTARGMRAAFHDAIDLAFALPAPMPAPVAAITASAPYLRIGTRLSTRPSAASYEVLANARITQKSRRTWRMSIDAALATSNELEVVLPDLSSVAGFDATWALPPDIERTITTTAYEKPSPLGDGSSESFTSATTTMAP